MQITTHNPESKYGLPVFVDFRGNAMPPSEGVKQLRILLDMTAADLAAACNVSVREVFNWQSEVSRRPPSAAALNVMRDLLDQVNPSFAPPVPGCS
jgi:hypothetical protein